MKTRTPHFPASASDCEPTSDASRFPSRLASGPGKLTQALAVDKSFNRADMINGRELYAASCGNEKFTVTKGPRIGIKKGLDLNRRFCVKNSRYLSA